MAIPQFEKVYALDYEFYAFTNSIIAHADCFNCAGNIPKESMRAIVTDPPYGVKEYDPNQLEKRANGNGGVWRIPPPFDGHQRSPLQRFTALNHQDRDRIQQYFSQWAQLVSTAIVDSCFEFQGQGMGLVKTLRGGDRPKNAEKEFPDVCTMPRGCYEQWGIFRKHIPNGMKVSECLKESQTGGLRRKSDGTPFEDVIESERSPQKEREIANHPSLKPQSFMRQIVYAPLALGEGIVLDPCMGSGSTVAAAEAVGYSCIGIERHEEY